MSRSAKAANRIKQEAKGDQSDQAGGQRRPIGSSRRPKATNRIKQKAKGDQSDQAGGGLSFPFSRRDAHIRGI
ncbi:hypothetical protein EYF80_055917 [Liparis tanakae]|uniref:Uncharacterized protein n=1 Tax=Liparis tanakae TaxID=230148 RepID=A0A4Z2EYS6_9TELE|nr:hypothetical protein EYF80_055917 [Liparis tanakae]